MKICEQTAKFCRNRVPTAGTSREELWVLFLSATLDRHEDALYE